MNQNNNALWKRKEKLKKDLNEIFGYEVIVK